MKFGEWTLVPDRYAPTYVYAKQCWWQKWQKKKVIGNWFYHWQGPEKNIIFCSYETYEKILKAWGNNLEERFNEVCNRD